MIRLCTPALAVSLLACGAVSLGAQTSSQQAKTSASNALSKANEGKTPIGWQTRFDATTVPPSDMHAGGTSASFVQMTPGFHVTTGPAGIYWHPDSSASGTFTVQSSIFISPPAVATVRGTAYSWAGRSCAVPGSGTPTFCCATTAVF